MENSAIVQLVHKNFEEGYSYEEYRALIDKLLEEEKSTTADGSEDLVEYSRLNQRRMKRWDKTLKLNPEVEEKLNALETPLKWLVISEGWCGDAAHVIPVLNKMAEFTDKIELKITLRDENPELMNQFLTNGGKSIPKLIILNAKTNKIEATWGPRPSTATKMVNDYKEEHGQLDASFKETLQIWYNKDKGRTTETEVIRLL